MMRILGIDPGYAIMGYGVLDYNGNRFKTVGYGSVETEAGLPMPERLKLLYDGLTEIIQKYEPDEVSIEELFFNRNVTTAIGVGEARGLLCSHALKVDLSCPNTHLCRLNRHLSDTVRRRRLRCR